MYSVFEQNMKEICECLAPWNKSDFSSAKKCIVVTAEALKNGHTLFICGNGGSAATASHIANDLLCHMKNWKRSGYRVMSLNDSAAVLTSLTNDYGFTEVFSKPLDAFGSAGDVIWGFSTSGNSKNVVSAFQLARDKGIMTIAFTGSAGGALKDVSDVWVAANSNDVVRVEELHLIYGHCIALNVEAIVSPMED